MPVPPAPELTALIIPELPMFPSKVLELASMPAPLGAVMVPVLLISPAALIEPNWATELVTKIPSSPEMVPLLTIAPTMLPRSSIAALPADIVPSLMIAPSMVALGVTYIANVGEPANVPLLTRFPVGSAGRHQRRQAALNSQAYGVKIRP
jgi:hypothetical protein